MYIRSFHYLDFRNENIIIGQLVGNLHYHYKCWVLCVLDLDKQAVLVDVIASGLTFEGFSSAEEAADTVANTWSDSAYLDVKEWAWEDLQDYYASLS